MRAKLTNKKKHVPENKKFRLPEACRKLIRELVCGAMILSAMAAAFGWAASMTADINIDEIDLTTRKDQINIERDDTFCGVIPFPCGPNKS
eukprot:10478790-Heterocapsa_arctica.AAC.1